MTIKVEIQTQDFDISTEIKLFSQNRKDIGAVVSFIGLVRDINESNQVKTLELEHYPGMTEKTIHAICKKAKDKWPIIQTTVIHRVGKLNPKDQIVLVLVSSKHRQSAFLACEFIMDFLKTQAPFWKKEQTDQGLIWLDAKDSDTESLNKWQDNAAKNTKI